MTLAVKTEEVDGVDVLDVMVTAETAGASRVMDVMFGGVEESVAMDLTVTGSLVTVDPVSVPS